jgi:multimeric flavodoxin WrbA
MENFENFEKIHNRGVMKTLIINGSPRKNGDTVSLINELLRDLNGERLVVNCYESKITPCIDCRVCWSHSGCYDDAEWRVFEDYMRACDNIIIASPIYFSELTGSLLSLVSKTQAYWAARHFRKVELITKPKKGGIILVGGGDGTMNKAEETARTILRHLNCCEIASAVVSHNTNEIPAMDDDFAVEGVRRLANYCNKENP